MTKLKKLLNEKNITVTQLAEMTSVSQRQARRLVNGHSKGKILWWLSVSKILNVTIEDILK